MAKVVVTNPTLHKKTLKQLKLHKNSIVISRVIRNKQTMIALSDTVILLGDKLVAIGEKEKLDKFTDFIGEKIEMDLENPDNIHLRKITVEAENVIGKTLKELKLRRKYGATVTRIVRNGIELRQNPNMPLIRGDVLTVVSTEDRLEEIEKFFC